MAKGYLIARIEVHDETAYREYAQKVSATLVGYEGKFLVRGGKTEPPEGESTAPGGAGHLVPGVPDRFGPG